jgi:3-hydroxyisobutyrate dehydrogenase-like beta-hydroxyacid dehydrogenase
MIGFLGVGRMGLPACANLVRAGYQIIAADQRAERERPVRAAGAVWAGDTRQVAAAAEILITMLPGPQELRVAMDLAIPSLGPGTTWIDMTSSSPAVGLELIELARRHRVECLEAPVGGDPTVAATGRLELFVGGSPDTVERHRALLEVLGNVNHVGGPGAGYTTKLLVNLLWFGQAVASAESLPLAHRAGIELDVFRAALGRSAAATEFIRHDLDALLDGDYLESFGLDRCCEELDAVVSLAGELDVPFELSATVAATYREALEGYGPVDGEMLAAALLEERAGVRLRHGR